MMTACCEIPTCREIVTGEHISPLQCPSDTDRMYNEFISLQNKLGSHLAQRHPEHMAQLNQMANTIGLLLVAKCFESSDPNFQESVKRSAEYARSLLSASFSMAEGMKSPETINIDPALSLNPSVDA